MRVGPDNAPRWLGAEGGGRRQGGGGGLGEGDGGTCGGTGVHLAHRCEPVARRRRAGHVVEAPHPVGDVPPLEQLVEVEVAARGDRVAHQANVHAVRRHVQSHYDVHHQLLQLPPFPVAEAVGRVDDEDDVGHAPGVDCAKGRRRRRSRRSRQNQRRRSNPVAS